jgi:hypothetical protein
MKPTIAPRPADPIDIDPGVSFKWVIAAKNATSVGFVPNANFTITQSGKTLSITCKGAVGAIAQTFALSVFASNSEGTVYQKLNFRIPARKLAVNPVFQVAVNSSAADIFFNTAEVHGPGNLVGDQFAVDWNVLFDAGVKGSGGSPAGANLSSKIFFIKSVAGRTFKVAATSGGTAVAQDAANDGIYGLTIAFALSGSDKLYVRDSSKFAVNDPITLSLTDGSLLPAELRGLLYVKSIINSAYIKVSATVGGAAISASADVLTSTLLAVSDGTRKHPSITSAEETDVDLLDAVDYTPTVDVAADEFEAEGLPQGLAINTATGEITGNPSEVGFFPILIIAYKGSGAGYRYWILVVGGDTGQVILPDAVYDIISKRFYSAVGPAGRADRIDRVLGDVSLLFGFEQNGESFTMPQGATVRVRAKQKLSDVADLVYATSGALSAPQSQVQLTEDWSAVAIAALLGGETRFVDLFFWLEWRLSGDPVGQYRRSLPFTVRVWRSDDVGLATTSPSYFLQTKPFTGGTAVALDSVATAGLAVDTWIARVIILNGDGTRTSSEWELVAGNDGEDVAGGIVRPDDYAAATNEKVWVRLD